MKVYLVAKRTDTPAGLLDPARDVGPRRSSYVKSYGQPIGGYLGALAPVPSRAPLIGTAGGAVTITETTGGLIGWILTNVDAGKAATGSITVVAQANLVDGETFTIDDGVNPALTFEYDVAGNGVGGGNRTVDVSGDTTVGQVQVTTIAAIQSAIDADLLDLTVEEGEDPGVILLTNTAIGAAGNVDITETVTDGGFVVDGMSGGVDAGALTGAQALTTITEIHARIGVGTNNDAEDLTPDLLTEVLTYGTWTDDMVAGLVRVLAGHTYVVPNGTVIESGGTFTNPGIEFGTPDHGLYFTGEAAVSVQEGRIARWVNAGWTYDGTSNTAYVGYTDGGRAVNLNRD